MLHIVTFLWSREAPHPKKRLFFSARHVNVLKNMVSRNLSLEHQFCCVTDMPDGIDDDVRILPLWDDLGYLWGCYRRLKLFSRGIEELIGPRLVCMDLDMVVTAPLDPLFDHDLEFRINADTARGTLYNGALFQLTAGTRTRVWDEFDPRTSPAETRKRGIIGTDQAWISLCLGEGEATFTPQDGVYSFRRHILYQGRNLPDGCRLVNFHGQYDPSQEVIQRHFPWVVEHWR